MRDATLDLKCHNAAMSLILLFKTGSGPQGMFFESKQPSTPPPDGELRPSRGPLEKVKVEVAEGRSGEEKTKRLRRIATRADTRAWID